MGRSESICLSFNQKDLYVAIQDCVVVLSLDDGRFRTLYTPTSPFPWIKNIDMSRGNQILVCTTYIRDDPYTTKSIPLFIWLSDDGNCLGKYTLSTRLSHNIDWDKDELRLIVKDFIICPYTGRLWVTIYGYPKTLEFE